FDYAFEVKNAAISARPDAWSAFEVGWGDPSIAMRLAYRPAEAWNIGVSVAEGAYLLPEAEKSAAFPAGRDRGDYLQQLVGADLSYAWHRFQLWAEIFASRFEVPHVDDADTLAYYLEGKYKINATLFAAVRWNQQFFGKVRDGLGSE